MVVKNIKEQLEDELLKASSLWITTAMIPKAVGHSYKAFYLYK